MCRENQQIFGNKIFWRIWRQEFLHFSTVGYFLTKIKKEFSSGDDKMIKIAKFKKIKQRSRTIKKFVQKFRRVARESRYKERPSIEEFKRDMNDIIR